MPENEITVPTPIVNPNEITQQVPTARPEDERASGSGPSRSGSGSGSESGSGSDHSGSGSGFGSGSDRSGSGLGDDETAMLPRVPDPERADPWPQVRESDETAVLPPVRGDRPSDRVPQGYFRDEGPAAPPAESENERTRELPQIEDPNAPAPGRQQQSGRRRPRPDWAEETPLDDLPTLADELLGGHDGGHEDDGRKGRGRRPRG